MSSSEHYQGAFLLQISPQTFAKGCLEGRVEHIASGHSVRFQALDELVAFVRRRLVDANLESEPGDAQVVPEDSESGQCLG